MNERYAPKSVYIVRCTDRTMLAIRAMVPLIIADDGIHIFGGPDRVPEWRHYGTVPNSRTIERVETMAHTLIAILDRP